MSSGPNFLRALLKSLILLRDVYLLGGLCLEMGAALFAFKVLDYFVQSVRMFCSS